MQSEGNANHFVSIGLNFGITVLCIFPTWIILNELEHSHEVPSGAELENRSEVDSSAEEEGVVAKDSKA